MSADGIWNCKINSPMGSQEGKMTLVTDGESLSGKDGRAARHQNLKGDQLPVVISLGKWR